MLKIYHNPRCSKSRETLELLLEKGVEPEIVEYLDTPPSPEELKEVLKKLGLEPTMILRRNEEVYMKNYAGKIYSDEEWIEILVENPILIERPIVVGDDKAVIGRPPENALKLIEKA